MIAQHAPGHRSPSITGRIARAARSMARRVDIIAFRGQLGPSRALEMRDFRPARRR
jgi:hypothetical protein